LVDPLDVEALYGAMDAVFQRPVRQAALRASGLLRARRFSWDEAARTTLAVLREVAARGRLGGRRAD
jgi:glycosyltransferase involved in cell wall biosynthesis